MSKLAFIDLAAQQEKIKERILARIEGVLAHGRYINGPEVAELERALAGYAGAPHAVGCSSGTDGLLMALMAFGAGEGDVVFTTSFTFIATAEVIRLAGANPVFVDIEPDTYNMDVAALEGAVEQVEAEGALQPKGVIPVDLFGQPADYDAVKAVADKHGLFVLSDAAQSFGSEYRGRKAGSLGHVAATSFFPAKPLGCYGDGGMVFTEDERLYESLLSIRVHGKGKDKYDNVRIGLNGRLDTLQAAVLLAKFEIFEEEILARQQVAERYSEALGDLYTVPAVREGNRSAWAQYTLEHPERDRIIASLKEVGIPSAVYYPKPLHLQSAFASLGYGEGDFPASERAAARVFSIPMHPYLGEPTQGRIIAALREAASA